ncbi:unnamed protein product [Tuber aestivum]|uniref:Uncharacterized protein n=1 Tax=Tuber aestivum TaxID=59557 RepID=A0A292PKG2_9PEZI|nr:unnamed protein product [Tuber aestivum]
MNPSNLGPIAAPVSLGATCSRPYRRQTRKPQTLDSWEDASTSSSSDDEANHPSPPPPTPTTPLTQTHTRNSSSVSSIASSRETGAPAVAGAAAGERPTTTDAVARRMISAALGVRAKSTKEQREYDTAVKAAERKKREGERERSRLEEEERERVRRGIWED